MFYRHVLDEWWKFSETFKDQIILVKIQRIKKNNSILKIQKDPLPPSFYNPFQPPDFLMRSHCLGGDGSWLAVWRKLTKPDWWPSADTDLSPAVGPERSETQNCLSTPLKVICTQACGLPQHCEKNKYQQIQLDISSLGGIPLQLSAEITHIKGN